MTNQHVPHLNIIISFCIAAICGYAVFSAWVVFYSGDQAQIGDVVGTWKSFAVAAFAFWLGSSSGGKARDADRPTGAPGDPVAVKEVQP